MITLSLLFLEVMQALISRPLQELLLLARVLLPRKLVTLVTYCLVTYCPIKQWLKETDVYSLTLSLWIRNSQVTSLGGSGSDLSCGCNSRCWPVLQLSSASMEQELFVRLITRLARWPCGRPQCFLTQASPQAPWLSSTQQLNSSGRGILRVK